MTDLSQKNFAKQLLSIPVIVAALGYMVDMYDLFLFSIVRVPSLKALNLPGEKLLENGIMLLNLQMAGMLIGGIIWGIMGDKKGRLSVLFGSILIYSIDLLQDLDLPVNWAQASHWSQKFYQKRNADMEQHW